MKSNAERMRRGDNRGTEKELSPRKKKRLKLNIMSGGSHYICALACIIKTVKRYSTRTLGVGVWMRELVALKLDVVEGGCR